MDHLDVVLGDFGRLLGIDDLAFERDECELIIGDDHIDLTADRTRGALVATAVVGAVPEGDRSDALAYLLGVNCAPDLDGAALGLAEDSDLVVLVSRVRAAKLDAAELQARLVAFVDALGLARGLIAPSDGVPAVEAGPRPSGVDEMMIRI